MSETGPENRKGKAVGSYLREIRESRGLSLEEAARVTRIGKNYLAAIEEESFDKLPSVAYIKGFLRVYAGYLGLSGDEIVAMYEGTLPSRSAQPLEETRQAGLQKKEKARGRGRWSIPLLLLVSVVAVAYIVEEKGDKTVRVESPPLPSPAKVLPAPVQPVRTSATQTEDRTASVKEPETKSEPVKESADLQTKGIILRLKVNQDSRLNITIDDTISQQYDLKAGDLIEWKGDQVFTLDLGNAGGIEAEFNGKPLKPFGEPGKPAHIVLKAEGT
ncbi:MAG: helix-turn-helix domain-containing [Geobacteraceae bacterium]|nr:MAG: helix-turn-helix domain-containing [Geobacteraceae bacterium]